VWVKNELMNFYFLLIILGLFSPASPQFMNILGSSYPTPGGTLSQNQVQASNTSFGSSGMLHDGNPGDNSPFDINDFPQLTGRPNSAGGGQGQYGNAKALAKSSILSV
jgi:CCR4-NOT transcription complex subunit 2